MTFSPKIGLNVIYIILGTIDPQSNFISTSYYQERQAIQKINILGNNMYLIESFNI